MKKIPPSQLSQLVKLVENDLKIRSDLIKNNELTKFGYHPKMKQVHDENLKFLEEFLSQYDWSKPSEYGKEIFEAVWFISIHAIDHRKQMKQSLKVIETFLKQGEDVAYQYASLYDRIALFEGRKQRYGTQLFASKKGWHPKNLDSYTQADLYRKQMGIPSIAEKIQEFDEDGIIDNEDEEQQKFEKWLNQSEWKQSKFD